MTSDSRAVAVRQPDPRRGDVTGANEAPLTELQAVLLLERAERMLTETGTVGEVKSVADWADLLHHAAKKARLGLDVQNRAAVLHLKAVAEAGRLLRVMAERGERATAGANQWSLHGATTTFTDLRIERTEAHRWDQVAAVPGEVHTAYVADAIARREEITLKGLLRYAATQPIAIPGDVSEIREAPYVRRGELYRLGAHRLYIADSTDPASVTELMAGEQAALLATDPPYLVGYQGGNHPQSWSNRPAVKDKHWDDYTDPDAGVAFYQAFLEAALPHLAPDAAIYQWHAERRRSLVEAAWAACGLLLHQIIIWRKKRGVLGYSQYQWQHEPCAYGWRQGHVPALRPPASATTVWDVDQVGECDGIHLTQKPVKLFRRPIEYHTNPGDIVLDPFLGSGTTIMAAEQLGRRAFCLEIEPAYAQAAIARWERLTGRQAVRG